MTRLNRLDIHWFRGIVDASLPFNGGSVLLGGGNGTGKTACVDAVEFLYTGRIGTLEGTQGLSLRHHGAHVQADPGATRVTGVFTDPAGEISRLLSGQVDVPAALDGHLQRGRSLSFILRRSQVQQFIHAKPADRYRSMADLIGLDDLERTEASLKRARDTVHRAVQEAEANLVAIDNREAALPEEIDDVDLLREANEGLAEVGIPSLRLASLDDIERVRAEVVRSIAPRTPDPAVIARARFAEELRRGVGEEQLQEALARYTELSSGAARTTDLRHMLDLLTVLRSGREYVKHSEDDHCPLCRQEVDARRLISSLNERVAQLEEISLRQQALDRARDELEAAIRDTDGSLRRLERGERELQLGGRALTALSTSLDMLRESLRAAAPVQTLEIIGRVRHALELWSEWGVTTAEKLRAAVPAERDGDDDETAQRANAALGVLQRTAERRAQSRRGIEERQRLEAERERIRASLKDRTRALTLADLAFATFNRIKNEEVQRVYDELQGYLLQFYDALHPGEGHGVVSIAMDPRKRGSSDLRMGFYGQDDADPRAYGSEGHLDSLGLCIFLAFVKRFNGDWPLLVLDDVVTSVDAAHKRRIARLLFEEFGDRQLLITTHDSRWFVDLQKTAAELGTADVHPLVIESWSIEQGPVLREAAV